LGTTETNINHADDKILLLSPFYQLSHVTPYDKLRFRNNSQITDPSDIL